MKQKMIMIVTNSCTPITNKYYVTNLVLVFCTHSRTDSRQSRQQTQRETERQRQRQTDRQNSNREKKVHAHTKKIFDYNKEVKIMCAAASLRL